MVWYSHLFKNFPKFVVIQTVKVFSVVSEADVFLEFSCFFDDPTDVDNLISDNLTFLFPTWILITLECTELHGLWGPEISGRSFFILSVALVPSVLIKVKQAVSCLKKTLKFSKRKYFLSRRSLKEFKTMNIAAVYGQIFTWHVSRSLPFRSPRLRDY